MINRAAMLLKYKLPALKWINEADPEVPDQGLSLDEVNSDRNVYLVKQETAESPEALREWVELNLDVLFESELECWHSDEDLWPTDLDLTLFDEWFELECHTAIIDTVEEPIGDDETIIH